MRRKLGGFGVSLLMVMAIGGLTAPPSFATDYFVKYLTEATTVGAGPCAAPPHGGPRHGSVVFRRTSSSMFATIYIRNAAPNSTFVATLFGRQPGGGCVASGMTLNVTTDSNGNATVRRGPLPRKGMAAYWVEVCQCPGELFATDEVPAFGF